jgi:hypothetical protein
MRSVLLILAIYAVPAVILYGATIALVRVARRPVLLPAEHAAWILPGLLYAVAPVLIYKAQAHGIALEQPPKGLVNLVDPVLVALLCWLVFVARIALARKLPARNRQAAYGAMLASVAVALGVLYFVPPLPQ